VVSSLRRMVRQMSEVSDELLYCIEEDPFLLMIRIWIFGRLTFVIVVSNSKKFSVS